MPSGSEVAASAAPAGEGGAPLWDLSAAYPGFDSPEYEQAVEQLGKLIGELGAAVSSNPSTGLAGWLKAIILRYNETADLHEDLAAYAYARFSVDTTDERAKKEVGRLERVALPLKGARVRLRAALREIDRARPGELLDAVDGDAALAPFRFFVEEQLELASKQMTPPEEELAADLSRAGGDAWGRLQESISSVLTSVWDEESGARRTVIELRMLAFDGDRSVRERAFTKELAAWRSMEIPLAAALNGVKGFSVTLNARRGYSDTLERSIRQSRITRKALDALIGVMTESLPIFRRYLNAKARLLGLPRLAFYDLFAPGGTGAGSWPYSEARRLITEVFTGFSREMGDLARKAFESGWIDARPREGKVGGAYCISFPLTKSSRIMCNYNSSFDDLTTVAHELGHAYHHEVLKDAPAAHRDYPMTLAETASIFSENLVFTHALGLVSKEQTLSILENFLQSATQVIVDILSRFWFEKALMERRADHELSPRELCELMIDAQKRTYGPSLDESRLHPYMWAVKGHYYSQELAYYNFPYAFGQLFGLGLYALSLSDKSGFVERYRGVLERSARASAVDVVASVGFDIESPEFWRRGISVVEERVGEFEHLAGVLLPSR